MSLYTGNFTFTCTSNATADACVAFIDAGLLACGFVQTATAGQLTSVTTFASGTAVTFGFREYEINDSLSGTSPLYIRVHYGTSTQGNTPTAGFLIKRVEAFMALSGTTPLYPIEMPDHAAGASDGGPVAIANIPVHLYKRDGLAVLIFGGMVTYANGGARQMGAVILRRSAVGGAHLIFPARTFGPGSYVSPRYAHVTPTASTAVQTYINAPAAGTIDGTVSGVIHALPLLLGNGTEVEVLNDVVIAGNVVASHYQLIDMATDISAPIQQYRLLPHTQTATEITASNQPGMPWVVTTTDRYAYALAYLP